MFEVLLLLLLLLLLIWIIWIIWPIFKNKRLFKRLSLGITLIILLFLSMGLLDTCLWSGFLAFIAFFTIITTEENIEKFFNIKISDVKKYKLLIIRLLTAGILPFLFLVTYIITPRRVDNLIGTDIYSIYRVKFNNADSYKVLINKKMYTLKNIKEILDRDVLILSRKNSGLIAKKVLKTNFEYEKKKYNCIAVSGEGSGRIFLVNPQKNWMKNLILILNVGAIRIISLEIMFIILYYFRFRCDRFLDFIYKRFGDNDNIKELIGEWCKLNKYPINNHEYSYSKPTFKIRGNLLLHANMIIGIRQNEDKIYLDFSDTQREIKVINKGNDNQPVGKISIDGETYIKFKSKEYKELSGIHKGRFLGKKGRFLGKIGKKRTYYTLEKDSIFGVDTDEELVLYQEDNEVFEIRGNISKPYKIDNTEDKIKTDGEKLKIDGVYYKQKK